jgi:hypothetical protein
MTIGEPDHEIAASVVQKESSVSLLAFCPGQLALVEAGHFSEAEVAAALAGCEP